MGRERGNRLRTGTSIGRLLRHACTDRKGWSVILVVTLLTSVFGLLRPWPIKILVDHVLGDAPMPLLLSVLAGMLPGADTPPGMLVWVVLSGLVIFAVSSLLEVLLTRAWIRVGQRMVYDLAAELFTRIQRRSLLFHSRHPVGDLLNRITGDCWCVYKVVDTYLFMPLFALMMIVAMVAVMLRTDVTLTLLAVVAAPFMIGTSLVLGRPMRLVARARREIDSAIKSHVQQTLLGIPVVQAFAQEEREQERFQSFARESLRAQRRGALLGSFAGLATGLAGTLGTGAVLWLGAHHVLEGRLRLGDLLVFIAYLAALQTQLKALTGLYGSFQEQSASADRVVELLDSEPEVRDRPDAVALASVEGLVCFENVSFGYDPGRPVLRDITLTVKPGQTVALVGATGAGKTTLASLIPRFFDPWHGRVTIDGMDLRNVRLADLRAQVGLVLQEPFLFSMTIAENIAFGNSRASRDEIEVAARAASLHDFIQTLPAGYDTPIGPRGLTLSGGERQRLAIARALLKNAPILILDEPTSALDAETERLFLQALTRLMRGRTTIILAHRLSTIRQADQIFVLEEGRVAEAGTHRQLLEQDGVYARLYGTPLGVPEPQAQLQGQR